MSNRLHVYVAGPMSNGDLQANIQKGIYWGKRMLGDGLAPYIPMLDAFMFMGELREDQYELLLEWDFAWIDRCDALFRIQGKSPGADREVSYARELGLPVFTEPGLNVGGGIPVYQDLVRFALDRQLHNEVGFVHSEGAR